MRNRLKSCFWKTCRCIVPCLTSMMPNYKFMWINRIIKLALFFLIIYSHVSKSSVLMFIFELADNSSTWSTLHIKENRYIDQIYIFYLTGAVLGKRFWRFTDGYLLTLILGIPREPFHAVFPFALWTNVDIVKLNKSTANRSFLIIKKAYFKPNSGL